MASEPVLQITNLCKTFTLHAQGGTRIPVLDRVNLTVSPGECVMLDGPSGSGKSTLLRSIYANYKPQAGSIRVRHHETWVDMVTSPPQHVLQVRRTTMGYVSQFLRVIPRVSAIDVVSEPLRELGVDLDEARQRATALLATLYIPPHLWDLAPATFSGGEQQRVNIARSFVLDYSILLLDEPTASLEAENRETVMGLIQAARQRGAAIVGISHDEYVRHTIGTRFYPMQVKETSACL
ncbi:MAG: phosphonate ABC transporter ATP-binding protein [Candidatus Entotheonella factor]|uniref:Phosphonate ABC transporter ATP-binding protein n=2 Tax=Candidatus Entotheonella TaxID=93171 RepID=W4LDI9_ENTF1|nr:MAG: phosphonate ABC transporter ATP-binding protein [Candidatus Entotheonella factor]